MGKRLLISLILFLTTIIAYSQARQKTSFNSNWQFQFDDEDPKQSINLPHTWNGKDIIDEQPGFLRGQAWYGKQFYIGEEHRGKQINLYFEGVSNRLNNIYINARPAGNHSGAFSGFRIPINHLVNFGDSNYVELFVDNSKSLSDSIPPYSGDFSLMGGIYRDVWLEITNPVRIEGHYGSSGVQFTINKIDASNAEFSVEVNLKGIEKQTFGTILFTLEKDGDTKTTGKARLTSSSDLVQSIDGSIPRPELWSPENPELYELTVVVVDLNGEIIDQVKTSVGFRWVGISPNKEFLLNGKPYKLRGASRHQDYAGIGNALTDDQHWNDIRLMKEMGCNFIRIAHYPQDPAIYDACDKLGLISWSEIPIVDRVVDSEAFHRNAENMMKEMISQNYNHPSVVMWGYHNEVRNLDKGTIENANRLNKIAKDFDPGRLTAMAFETNFDNGYFQNPLLKDILAIPDIIGYNVYEAWYRGNLRGLPYVFQALEKIASQKPFMLSEYGAGSSTHIHTNQPTIFDFSEEYQCLFNEAYLDAGKKFRSMIGWAIWNFIDFQRDGREDVQPNINNKGMVTTSRIPKDVYYLYKANWSREPFVYIAGKNWSKRFYFSENAMVRDTIVVYSNQPALQLYCNGVKQNLFNSSNGKFRFIVNLQNGKNNLTCKTMDNKLTDVLNLNADFISIKKFQNQFPGYQLCFNTGQTRTYYSNLSNTEHWLPDKPYSTGSWGYSGGEVYRSWRGNPSWDGIREGVHQPVYRTEDEPVFQTFVEGLSEWKADVPSGKYRVSLYLCEPLTAAQRNNQAREISIKINEEELTSHLNLEREYGLLTAVILDKELVVQEKGIRVNFISHSGKTILNGIKIQKLD